MSALANKFGCKSVTIVGSVIACIAYFISTYSTSVDVLILTYGALGGRFECVCVGGRWEVGLNVCVLGGGTLEVSLCVCALVCLSVIPTYGALGGRSVNVCVFVCLSVCLSA